MQIGIVGKPNVGKTTFFNASVHAEAEIANYPFTTINANKGVMYARSECPCKEYGLECNPNNSKCIDGIRYIPIEAIDVAGLVPKAHEGRGLGNKFLDDLRQASCLIHIVDVSGSTDEEGRPCETGSHDPSNDIKFLEEEIDFWIKGLLEKDWRRMSSRCKIERIKIEKMLAEKLTGLGIREEEIKIAIRKSSLPEDATLWKDEDLLKFSTYVRKESKPILLALNKADKASDEMVKKFEGEYAIPTSAISELTLIKAVEHGFIEYKPGDSFFKVIKEMDDKRRKGLEYIKTHVMDRFGSTGVQECIDKAVFNLLGLIEVYPVEDENKLCDKNGNVLPDVFLLPKGSTVIDLAYKVHSDLAEGFIRAVDARTKKIVGADHVLKNKDIIHIIAK
ncbi:MAG TPA: redox-regulated ATPase YchF [Thermoplasmatales archaeon]|nr:redox-regulated ATPase YchF [Thermoplasmatales archaeon]